MRNPEELSGIDDILGSNGSVGQPAKPGKAKRTRSSEDAIALRFAERHADDLRYVALWSRWLEWDGRCWRFDDTIRAFDLVRRLCREAGEFNAKTVAAVERLAKSDRRLAATIDQWDADPWLLNTPDGIVDLRTGEMHPSRPEDYCTKITAAAPGNAPCPMWLAFLRRVTGGNEELIAFLRRMCGYALTGVTRDHALFFGYGAGGNGKSVFVETVASTLNDYHCSAPIETFAASSVDRHPTELADLRGARLVTSVETEEGRRWAESRIKMLTGGDRVKARFIRQEFFEFAPQLKLFIIGNHKPSLRSVDEAMRRRFNLVPFSVTIPPEERDAELTAKLKAELPGILSWMIDGCLDWQDVGLRAPEVVMAATASYLEAEDGVAAWIEDSCEPDRNAWETRGRLFESWTTWAEKAGEFVGSQKRFVQVLESRGYLPERRKHGRGFLGLRVKGGDTW